MQDTSGQLPPILVDRLVQVPVDEIMPHPDNPNEGDVGAIVESYRSHGIVEPIVCQAPVKGRRKSYRCVNGEHRWRAARIVGLDTIPVIPLDITDDQARRLLVTLNPIARRGHDDPAKVLAILEDLVATTEGLAGTGYEPEDMDDLLADLAALDFGDSSDPDAGEDGVEEPGLNDEHYTPAYIFEALDCRFDLDVAAPDGGVPWIPADRFYTKADDGLAQPWDGFVWCNPPFSVASTWARRFIEHRNGILLNPTSKARWLCEVSAAAELIFIPHTPLDYERPNGELATAIRYATMLWGLGDAAIEPMERLVAGVPGVLLQPVQDTIDTAT